MLFCSSIIRYNNSSNNFLARYTEYLNNTSEYYVQSVHKYVNQYLFEEKKYKEHAAR